MATTPADEVILKTDVLGRVKMPRERREALLDDFDLAGRNTIVTYGDNTSVTNTYDSLGRLTIVSDGLGSRTNIYDNLSRLIAARDAGGQSYGAILDVDDRATTLTNANGMVVTQTFDDLGRLRTRTYPDSGVEAFGYSTLGLVKYTNQLSKVTSYGYCQRAVKTSQGWADENQPL